MKKVKIRANAKINLTLDIVGVKDHYHILNSLVSSINVSDTVIVKRRKDKNITVKVKGIKLNCDLRENNAYKSASAFMQGFNTDGVDIIIKKSIPIGGGLGGSSADIVGVIKGMATLYDIKEDLTNLLLSLGSDTLYMYKGGYALMQGRGDEIKPLNLDKKLYFVLMTASKLISSKFAFSLCDKMNVLQDCKTDKAVDCLIKNDYEGFTENLNNHLYVASKEILGEIEENVKILSNYGKANMTGSGNVTYLVFDNAERQKEVYKELLEKYKNKILKAETV